MAAYDSAGFEIGNRLAPGTFPAARLNRRGPEPGVSGTPGAVPWGSNIGRTRAFPFYINETAARRHTVSTPKLLGNVIINSVSFSSGSHADPPNDTLEIGYALNPVTETAVLLTVPRPYTVLTEVIDPFNIIANDRGSGFPGTTLNTPTRGSRIPLGLIVMERELAVTVSVVNPSGFIQTWIGYLSVTENLSNEALGRYLVAA